MQVVHSVSKGGQRLSIAAQSTVGSRISAKFGARVIALNVVWLKSWSAKALNRASNAVAHHQVAARLGHADPSVTLRVYSHVLREHAQGIGDVYAQAIKASVSKSVSNGRNDS
jgi:hypothetical protein